MITFPDNKYLVIYFFIIGYMLIYAFFKEKSELGCNNFRCNEYNSVYYKDTSPVEGDSKELTKSKLKKIFSFYEQNGIWKRCFLIAALITILIKVFQVDIKLETLIILNLIIFFILYFYHNFMNHHYYKTGKKIGESLLEKL